MRIDKRSQTTSIIGNSLHDHEKYEKDFAADGIDEYEDNEFSMLVVARQNQGSFTMFIASDTSTLVDTYYSFVGQVHNQQRNQRSSVPLRNSPGLNASFFQ